ncbi:ankyrin repeat domain-containing protein [Amycolatopsis sp. NBC_00355]|uniref:ankyrin repeat domain-containing protein n=1 Tax=Amycolatopsis sp. NBC_00355 TaxID=2975957 RepID=UPI002E257F18
MTALHDAAERGTPEAVAELARQTTDVDAVDAADTEAGGATPLWHAVHARRPENARVLVAAGADPWRPMMAGWAPGRLALAGPTPDLFGPPPDGVALTDAEAATVAAATGLAAAFPDFWLEGTGFACVAAIDAAEAARRLGARPAAPEVARALLDDPWAAGGTDEVVGVTDVPGGCVLTQPWGYLPQTPVVTGLLSAGTVCYGVYANPKSGDQGCLVRDGVTEGSDLHPGGWPYADSSSAEVLLSYLHEGNAAAYACAYAGLRPVDARSIAGPPDTWLVLPERDYFASTVD